MWHSLRTCLALLSLTASVKGASDACSFSAPLQVASPGDGLSVDLGLDKPAFVTSIHFNVCQDYASLKNRNFTISFIDPNDLLQEERLFSKDTLGTLSATHAQFVLKLERPIYASRVILSQSDTMPCSYVSLHGCYNIDMCDPTFCKNGGTCVGEDQCSCVTGYMGPSCESTVNEMTFDDFDFVTDVQGTLYTQSAAFNVSGEVSFTYEGQGDPSTGHRSVRSHGHHHFAHFHGHGGSCHLLPSSLSSFLGSHQNTYGHHPSHNVFSALNNFANGFSHTVQATIGSHHHSQSPFYFYTTHGTHHHSHGCSLHFLQNALHMHVHFHRHGHHHHYSLSANFPFKPGHLTTIVSSFSHHHGISIFANGHKLGSLVLPHLTPGSPSLPSVLRPLCFGHCSTHGHNGHQLSVGNIAVAGASVPTLAKNFLLGMLGLPMLNLLGASHHTTAAHLQTTKIATTTHKPTTVQITTAAATSTTKTPTATTKKFLGFTLAPATATTLPPTSKRTTVQPGPNCYSCAQASSTGGCSSTVQCYSGEVCTVYNNGGSDFTHRCMSKQLCDAKKKAASGCWKCCTTDLCNKNCAATTPASTCQDKPRCSALLAIGYNACNDPVASTFLCPKYCNKCQAFG